MKSSRKSLVAFALLLALSESTVFGQSGRGFDLRTWTNEVEVKLPADAIPCGGCKHRR